MSGELVLAPCVMLERRAPIPSKISATTRIWSLGKTAHRGANSWKLDYEVRKARSPNTQRQGGTPRARYLPGIFQITNRFHETRRFSGTRYSVDHQNGCYFCRLGRWGSIERGLGVESLPWGRKNKNIRNVKLPTPSTNPPQLLSDFP